MKKAISILFLLLQVCNYTLAKTKSVDIGPDQTIVPGEVVHLTGKITKGKIYVWETNGTGQFTRPNSLKTDYVPSEADIEKGRVKITLKHYLFPLIQDYMFIRIRKCPSVNIIRSSDTLCKIEGISYKLEVEATGKGFKVQWSTNGNGEFTYSDSLKTSYVPSDFADQSVLLQVTLSDTSGKCPAMSDVLDLKFKEPATINLPPVYKYSCGTAPVFMNANSRGATTTIYRETSGTGYFLSYNTQETYYIPSQDDIRNGSVTISATEIDPEGCMISNQQTTIQFSAPVIDAGPDIVECGYEWGGELYLNGTSGTGGIYWTTNGYGYFDDPYSPTPIYFYSPSDVNLAFIEIYASSAGGTCDSYKDTVSVWLQASPNLVFPEPNVYQYGDEPVNASVYLYGHASSGTWSSSGSGYFADPGSPYTSYYPSVDDKLNGCVELYFITNDPEGPCGPASGSMSACFSPPCPTISSGADITECGYLSGGMVYVEATTSMSDYVEWYTSGSGYFEDPYASSTYYYYDASDVNNAAVELTATAYNWSGCSASDNIVVYLQSAPHLEFPEPNVSGCANEAVYANVYLYGYASSGTWSTAGSGTFSDASSAYTTYYPSAEDAQSGCVDLIFTTNDPDGPCGATSGSMSACFYECSSDARTGSLSSADGLLLLPNPATDILEIKGNQKIDASGSYILNIVGSKLAINWLSENSLNISDLAPGYYFLYLKTNAGNHAVKKFKKQ